MAMKRRLFAAGATLLTAAVIGHLVQNGGQLFARGSAPDKAKPAVVAAASLDSASVTALSAKPDGLIEPGSEQAILPTLPADVIGEAGIAPVAADLPQRIAGLDQGHAVPQTDAQDFDQYGLQCDNSLTAKPATAGMVTLTLNAPCFPNMRVSVFHDALRFSAKTDATGQLIVDMPALVTNAAFMVQLNDETILSAIAAVPDAQEYDRVALQWQGRNAMQIHAFEFGAEFGKAGHVWGDAPSTPDAGQGGFLTVLGDASLPFGQMVEVYSYPRGTARDEGVVRLSVEAEVTAANCGREIMAETLQPGADGRMEPAELTLFMPDCDAKGEFLVLKNVLQDMKIARN